MRKRVSETQAMHVGLTLTPEVIFTSAILLLLVALAAFIHGYYWRQRTLVLEQEQREDRLTFEALIQGKHLVVPLGSYFERLASETAEHPGGRDDNDVGRAGTYHLLHTTRGAHSVALDQDTRVISLVPFRIAEVAQHPAQGATAHKSRPATASGTTG